MFYSVHITKIYLSIMLSVNMRALGDQHNLLISLLKAFKILLA